MGSERVSGDQHQPHDHDDDEQEQLKPLEACCCKGASNCVVKIEQDLEARLTASISDKVKNIIHREIQLYIMPWLQNIGLSLNSSSSLHQAASRTLELKFKGDIPDTLFTLDKIGDDGTSLEVELLDSGKRVEVGPESSVKIKIDVLAGDFDADARDDWTEDYTRYVAKPRKNKGALLKGECRIEIIRGVASFSHIAFTDNSKERTNGIFKLGAKVVQDLPPGVVVKPAVSKSLTVKERRTKNVKHKIPSAQHPIWHLVHIGKDGPIYERAAKAGIRTVENFLQCYHTDSQELQRILNLPQNYWNATVKNAQACKSPDELYRYRYDDDVSGDVLLLDWVFNIQSVAFKDQNWQPYKDLDDFQKKQAAKLRHSAYDKLKHGKLAKIDNSATQLPVQAVFPHPFDGVQQGEHHPSPPLSLNPNIGEHHPPSNMDPSINNWQQMTYPSTSACLSNGAYGVANFGQDSWIPLPDESFGPDISSYYNCREDFQGEVDILDYIPQMEQSPFPSGYVDANSSHGLTDTQALCGLDELRTKTSRNWCVFKVVKWVISLRRNAVISCRPQKKQRI